jgi:hypothetical protein
VLIGALGGADEIPPLPGPGLDLPVDTDGDGVSSYGDRYAFNYWLAHGGKLEPVLLSAVVTESGILDLAGFFSSPAAVLSLTPPQLSEARVAGTGGGVAQANGCPTLATIVAPFGEPTVPVGLFADCQDEFENPTGFAVDTEKRLWASTLGAQSALQLGVVRVDLSQTPNDGTIPVGPERIDFVGGVIDAEGIVIRAESPADIDVLVTEPSGDRVWRFDDGLQCVEIDPSSQAAVPVDLPFGIDILPPGAPPIFGTPGNVVFSEDRLFGGAAPPSIRRADIAGICGMPVDTVVSTLLSLAIDKPQSVAVGNFNGAGTFGVYYVAGNQVRRVIDNGAGGFVDELFSVPEEISQLRSIEFDPISGDLFVSEETGANLDGIWRIAANGTVRLFGVDFDSPRGIAFLSTGVMLVSEDRNVLVVGGWRNKFKRGDANGDGNVLIADAQFVLNFLFLGGAVPPCLDGADANDDSSINLADPIRILFYLFLGGGPPPAPGPNTCGRDPTPDLLDCITSLGAGCAIP